MQAKPLFWEVIVKAFIRDSYELSLNGNYLYVTGYWYLFIYLFVYLFTTVRPEVCATWMQVENEKK